jgi:hypothetical protein
MRLVCFAVALVAGALAACDDEKTDDTVVTPSTPLKVEEIIAVPKAAEPMDTVAMTAVLESSSPNVGDIPVTKWSADGGAFVRDDLTTVQWVAPAQPGLYRITARATNNAGTVTRSRDFFVGEVTTLVTSQAGGVRLKADGTNFFYLRSPDVTLGVEVFTYDGGPADAVTPLSPRGFELVYAPTLAYEVHATTITNTFDSLGVTGISLPPRHLYTGTFATKVAQRITQDRSLFDSARRNRFSSPNVSPDGQMIAYQGQVTDPFTASLDSFDIFIYKPAGPTRTRATLTHTNHRNFYPSFSTDQNWLTFISDRGGANQWEMYGMPVSGTTVDTNPASVVRLTDTGGTVTNTLSGVPVPPRRLWNPAMPKLAMITADGILSILTTAGGGATLQEVTGLPTGIQELAWSGGGNSLAVVTTGGKVGDRNVSQVFLVTGTSAQLLHTAAVGDGIRDVLLVPGGQLLVYRVSRGASAWFEVLDLTGALEAPVPVMATLPGGDAAIYRSIMSLAPVWANGNKLIGPAFIAPETPGIIQIDLSGAVQ